MFTKPMRAPSGRYYWRGTAVQSDTLGGAWLGVLRELTKQRSA